MLLTRKRYPGWDAAATESRPGACKDGRRGDRTARRRARMASPSSATKTSRTSASRRAAWPRTSAITVTTSATAVKNPRIPMSISIRWARALGCIGMVVSP